MTLEALKISRILDGNAASAETPFALGVKAKLASPDAVDHREIAAVRIPEHEPRVSVSTTHVLGNKIS
jgi:hypothetical protein